MTERNVRTHDRAVNWLVLALGLLLAGAIVFSKDSQRLGIALMAAAVLPLGLHMLGAFWRSFRSHD